MQETEIWPYEQMVYTQFRVSPGEWEAQKPMGISDTNGSPNLRQTIRPCNKQQEKENLPNCGLYCPDWP